MRVLVCWSQWIARQNFSFVFLTEKLDNEPVPLSSKSYFYNSAQLTAMRSTYTVDFKSWVVRPLQEYKTTDMKLCWSWHDRILSSTSSVPFSLHSPWLQELKKEM